MSCAERPHEIRTAAAGLFDPICGKAVGVTPGRIKSKSPSLWRTQSKPIVGMIHLEALPGSPNYQGSHELIERSMLRDAEALVAGGVDGLMLENFNDVPFFPARVPPPVIAQMTALACEIRRLYPKVPLGINVLRNDGCGALSVAHACGAQFIRVNVLCGARGADQGILHGIAHELLRLRAVLGSDVRIFADIDVKHSAPLAARPLEEEVEDTLHRGLADALIVSGAGTGKPTDVDHARRVKAAAGTAIVFVGSGITSDTIGKFLPYADGFIVGTSLKRGGNPRNPVERKRVLRLIDAVTR